MDLRQLTQLAIEAATKAGVIVQQFTDLDIFIEHKQAGSSKASQVLTQVDKDCEKVILDCLLPSCIEYDIAILTEESEDDGSRFKKEFFWCIDPLDGTLPFIEKRSGFSTSIALVSKFGEPMIGVVYDPTTENLYYAAKNMGVYKNERPFIIKHANRFLTYFTDRKLNETPGGSQIKDHLHKIKRSKELNEMKEVSGAGSVMNAIYVLENGPACMIKLPKNEKGGGSLWDFAATACIFNELKLEATAYSGDPLDLNRRESTFMNHQGVYFANL